MIKMIRRKFAANSLLTFCAFFSNTQVLFAEDATPVINEHFHFKQQSEADRQARTNLLDGIQAARIEKIRHLYGSQNGLILIEVQNALLAAFARRDLLLTQKTFEEWKKLYQAVPVDARRGLARHALFIGSEMLSKGEDRQFDNIGQSIIGCVLDLSENARWYKDEALKSEFANIAANKKLDDHRHVQAVRAMGSEPIEKVLLVDNLLRTIEEKLKTCMTGCRLEVQPVDYKNYRLSWLSDDENNSGHVYTVSILSSSDSAVLLGAITELIPAYASLQNSDQQIFASRAMDVTGPLHATNLHLAADTLFWNVFRTINPLWVNGDVSRLSLAGNNYYAQTYDLPKAISILKKEIELEELATGNPASEVNLRTVLGDTYDEMGQKEEAIQQWSIAKSVNSQMMVVEFDKEYLEREAKVLERRLQSK